MPVVVKLLIKLPHQSVSKLPPAFHVFRAVQHLAAAHSERRLCTSQDAFSCSLKCIRTSAGAKHPVAAPPPHTALPPSCCSATGCPHPSSACTCMRNGTTLHEPVRAKDTRLLCSSGCKVGGQSWLQAAALAWRSQGLTAGFSLIRASQQAALLSWHGRFAVLPVQTQV